MSQAPVKEQDVFARQLQKSKKTKQSIWKKLGVGVLVVGATSVAWLAFTRKGNETYDGMSKVTRVLMDTDLLFNNVGGDRVNILLVGEDYNWVVKPVLNPRTGKKAPFQVVDTDSPPRSDTMIVMSLDRVDGAIRMLSMPRDARITYTDLDGDNHRRRKLNAVYSSGGVEPANRQRLLRTVLADEFGIRIDRIAVIKPNSFKKLVDMVGGVYVNVDGALKLNRRTGKLYRGKIEYEDSWGQWKVNLEPGPQWLNGEQAHGYVRFRNDREGDPGRIRRQQMVMKAIAKRITETPIWNLSDLAKDIRLQFRTDMTDEELISLGYFAKSKMGDSAKIQPMTLYGTYANNGDVVLNRPKNEKLLTAIFGSSFDVNSFLVRSPSTRGDDIGPANNANPAIQAFLKKAGLLDDEQILAAANSPVVNAPAVGGEGDAGSSPLERERAEAAPASEAESRPRRRRVREAVKTDPTPISMVETQAPPEVFEEGAVPAVEPEVLPPPAGNGNSPVPVPE